MSRVLHIISGLGVGGAEKYLAGLAPQLEGRGIAQHVVSLSGDGPTAADLASAGIAYTLLDLRRQPIASLRALLRLTQSFNPTVIQGWMYHGDLIATIVHRLAKRRKRQLYWGVRCSDMNLDQYALQLRLVVRACSHLSGQPDLVIANNHAGKRSHSVMGYKPKRWSVIHNGVDIARFAPDADSRRAVRTEMGLDDETVLAFHVARVDPMKGYDVLLAACEKVQTQTTGPKLVVALVGFGTQSLALPDGVRALGPQTNVPRLLAGGDIIISSSLFGEGFPNALAEGMAVGLFPVATDVGDSSLLVGEVSDPILPNDVDALAAAIKTAARYVHADMKSARQLSRNRMVDHFDAASSVAAFVRVYKEGPAALDAHIRASAG